MEYIINVTKDDCYQYVLTEKYFDSLDVSVTKEEYEFIVQAFKKMRIAQDIIEKKLNGG